MHNQLAREDGENEVFVKLSMTKQIFYFSEGMHKGSAIINGNIHQLKME